jgi:CheY-like chemotaxis protein
MHGRILLAAVSSNGRATISSILECMGLQVEVTCDGRVAFQIALSAWQNGRPFDLLMMDTRMPIIDGYEATALLRSVGYPGRIIALASCTFQDAHNKSSAAGCDGYASKPISYRTLRNAVQRYLPATKS